MTGLPLATLLALGTLAGATFAVVAVLTGPFARWLSARQVGKAIREDGPDHAGKAGTPTMGGIVLLFALAGVGLTLARTAVLPPGAGDGAGAGVELALLALALFAVLGALDDWAGLARKGQARELGIGLSARRMLLLQTLVAALLAWLCLAGSPDAPATAAWTASFLPDAVAARGAWLWYGLALVALVGTVNGVNLSDGLDGLAAGLAAIAFSAYGLLLLGTGWLTEAGFALCAAAACLGFLVWNRHPARVFMGNVTSMALGGALATLALVTGTWPLLPLIGLVYVAEVASDLIQIGYFKISGGRRVFRMAPIHHHFELGGWPETTVVARFWAAGLLAALVGTALGWLAAG